MPYRLQRVRKEQAKDNKASVCWVIFNKFILLMWLVFNSFHNYEKYLYKMSTDYKFCVIYKSMVNESAAHAEKQVLL